VQDEPIDEDFDFSFEMRAEIMEKVRETDSAHEVNGLNSKKSLKCKF
jgi:hypothetical protein